VRLADNQFVISPPPAQIVIQQTPVSLIDLHRTNAVAALVGRIGSGFSVVTR
jgi:hypothetical protein